MNKPSTLALIILDGFGYREEPEHNAIAAANTPHWDALWQQHPHLLIEGSGHYVGLPDQQMGNSEVGHLNIGAGRIVYQDYTRISEAIENKAFFENPVLLEAIAKAKQKDSALHIIGLVSPGGVHSHEAHIHALIDLAHQQQLTDINLHAFLDGRDTPPQSAEASLLSFEEHFRRIGSGQIASLVGRYYAMDRDQRWDRIQAAYDLLTLGKAQRHATTACMGLTQAYHDGETDEFVKPTSIHTEKGEPITIKDNDVVIFMNFRADRARQISYAFTADDFHGFERKVYPNLADFVSLTQYADDLSVSVAYPPQSLDNTLGEVIAKQGLKQLRIAETEKYAHVTFFFNGGKEAEFAGEGRLLIPSPQVATYDLQPKMSASELTDKLVAAIEKQQFDVIICNFANPDMVGHTGNFPAAVQAVETIDQCIGRLMEALHKAKGEMLVTADHGNVECMFNKETGQPHTAHTSNPVPLCYYSQRRAHFCEEHGKLSDIAPTMLSLLGIEIPQEMTGKNLIQLD